MNTGKPYAAVLADEVTKPLAQALASQAVVTAAPVQQMIQSALASTTEPVRQMVEAATSSIAADISAMANKAITISNPHGLVQASTAINAFLSSAEYTRSVTDLWARVVMHEAIDVDRLNKSIGAHLAASIPSSLSLLEGLTADTDEEIKPEALPPLTRPSRAERANLTSATRAFKDFPLWHETYALLRHHYGNLSRAQLHTLQLLTSALVFTAVLIGVTTLTDNDPALDHAMDNVGADPSWLASSAGGGTLWLGHIAIRRHPINKRIDRKPGR